ncbi:MULTISPECIES: hypothetical protein [unclassified Streptomyces]|uniref:hypothetical protein n=1 Tax=unclassified Streptomyces TaxID=2593676 RepID=UPI00225430C2|nr:MULTISPECIES: hypothetical protein [unclassified Streptomyces]MCX4991369.1 hypothetical protein [Streptomyces sp. NBC_00568]MCX5003394.1 hypothetical protein [Streptomyces sp. NBC_00638]
MVSVPWQDIARTPTVSEALVTMLVLRLRPRAQEVDGTGGDGGRDLYEYTESGELIHYEAKSFTGRMTSSRREQVRRSLVSTARYQPDQWDLLVPISPNPAEMRWFEGLRDEFPFVRNWRGLNWLNQHFAEHADLVRYALQESGDYILDRIAEARAERDLLIGGIPDLIDRYRALQVRAQEISPNYAISASLDLNGGTAIHLSPTGNEPDSRSTIRFTGKFAFQQSDPEERRRLKRFEDALRYGGEVELSGGNVQGVTIDAPSELGISGSFVPEAVRIEANRETLTPPLRAQLVVRAASGIPTASLPLQFIERTTGTDGGTLLGGDVTAFMHVKMRYDNRNRSWRQTLSFTPPEEALPQALVPVLRLISRARAGSMMEVAFQGPSSTRLSAPISQGMTPGGWDVDEAERWADAYEALAILQTMTGQFFPAPADFTMRDGNDAREAVSLLRGEKVSLAASTVSIGVVREEAFELLTTSDTFALAATYEGMLLSFGEYQVDLGPCIETLVVDKVLNLRDAKREFVNTGHATVRMRVSKSAPAQRYLGTQLPGADSA